MNAQILQREMIGHPLLSGSAIMKNLLRLTLAAFAAAGILAPAFPAHAGLVMTISDSLGTTPVTVNGTQPGGPGTDYVATYSGSFGPVNLIISVGDSNSPTLTDP